MRLSRCLLIVLICAWVSGCIPPDPHAGLFASDEGDSPSGDDDDVMASDDDFSADDDTSDDDTSDDDDVADGLPATPGGYMFDVSFAASGGGGPGTATVELIWTLFDDTQNQNQLCSYTYEYQAGYPAVAPEQGDDFYPEIDLVLSFESGELSETNCPSRYDEFVGADDPVAAVQWLIAPIAVITCDRIRSNPELGATQYIDDLYGAGMTDGTMLSWCDEFGPAAASTWDLGPIEGLWLKPSDSETGSGSYGVAHFAAPNGDIGGLGTCDSWSAMGTIFAVSSNPYEPAAGLEGGYVNIPIWIFSYED
jgi:hypothetical protein